MKPKKHLYAKIRATFERFSILVSMGPEKLPKLTKLKHNLHFLNQDDPKSGIWAPKRLPTAAKSEQKHAKTNPGKKPLNGM